MAELQLRYIMFTMPDRKWQTNWAMGRPSCEKFHMFTPPRSTKICNLRMHPNTSVWL